MSFGVSGKYRLDRRLGAGGMAEVFAGSTQGAEGFSRKVAIKRVRPGFSDNANFARLFVAEAQLSARLVHPNIVSVLDFDRDAEGRLFLVMELVDGKDLDALLGSGRLPWPVVIFVIGEILRGLGFAHDLPAGSDLRGVIHRDVSPHNVLLSWEGAVKVSDFGIAKARAASEATGSTLIRGKPAYMSPEQANGERLDGRSDLFAVGVMLWEMLVGQRLFVAQDVRAVFSAVLFGKIPRPRALRPDIPKDLERVTMKLLERDRAARYATAEAALADLMHCADAPRSGRDALSALLAERFPDSAPIRQNVARARALGTPPASPPGQPPYPRLPAGAGSPVSALASTQPGLGTLMLAPTQAMPPARRWLVQAAIVVAVALASGVAGFVIVSAVKHRPATGQPRDPGPGSAMPAPTASPGSPAPTAPSGQPAPTAPSGSPSPTGPTGSTDSTGPTGSTGSPDHSPRSPSSAAPAGRRPMQRLREQRLASWVDARHHMAPAVAQSSCNRRVSGEKSSLAHFVTSRDAPPHSAAHSPPYGDTPLTGSGWARKFSRTASQ